MSNGFEEHSHPAVVHDHVHRHVTHNWSDQAQTFVHLGSEHAHTHDHGELTHAHFPHENFEAEHQGEAHDHSHTTPVQPETKRAGSVSKKVTAKKGTTTKATAKKATTKRTAAKKTTG